MNDTIDLLQIKIEKAKAQLSNDTLNAINAVDWKAVILGMRERKGYSFEQLGDLELETELVLCGLLSPKNYPKELESRMKLSKPQAEALVNEMNEQVFAKIREELIKNTERKKIFAEKFQSAQKTLPRDTEEEKKNNTQVFKNHGIEIIGNGNGKPASPPTSPNQDESQGSKETLPIPEKLELKGDVINPILAQKLSGSVQIPTVRTEHTLDNLTKINTPNPGNTKVEKPKVDPYREIPE